MDIHDNQLQNLAKKYKKMFEKISINVGACLLNGSEFYWVNYYRFNKMIGHAIISPNNITNMKDYEDAFYYLAKSSQLRSNFASNAGFRAKINMNSFTSMESFLQTILNELDLENDSQVVKDSLDTVQRILDLQNQLIDKYHTFSEKEEKVQNGAVRFCEPEYLDFVLDSIAEIDYIQFTQLNLQYEAIPKFDYIKQMSKKNPNVKRYMNRDINVYLDEFIKSKNNLLNNIKSVTFHPELKLGLSKERHKELLKESLLHNIDKETKDAERYLRYPKIR